MPFIRGVQCDECGARAMYDDTGRSITKNCLKDWLRENGWTFGKRILCPLCKTSKKRGGRS